MLDELEEQRAAVGDRRGEQLEEVAVIVGVGEDVERFQHVPVTSRGPEPVAGLLVIARRAGEEPHAAAAHRVDGRAHVIAGDRHVLHAGALVGVEEALRLPGVVRRRRLGQHDRDIVGATKDDAAHAADGVPDFGAVADIHSFEPEDHLVGLGDRVRWTHGAGST